MHIAAASSSSNNAITQLLILMEARPKDIALKEKLYSIYLEAEKLSDAAELLRQMHDIEPSNLNHLVRRLDILRKEDNDQEILEVCKILHQEKPFQYPACSLYVGIFMSESANGSVIQNYGLKQKSCSKTPTPNWRSLTPRNRFLAVFIFAGPS